MLKCTTLKENALEKTTNELLHVSNEFYKKIGRTKTAVNDEEDKNAKKIYTHTYQRTIVDQYDDFL